MTKTISKALYSTTSAKAIKAASKGVLNAIHYMSPYDIAGVGNLCPFASEGCKALCLGYHSGQASMVANSSDVTNKNNVRLSRDVKAQQYMTDRPRYLAALQKQLDKLIAQAKSENKELVVRLNGSTDINWAKFYAANPDVQFVEYTKSLTRVLTWLKSGASNVHMTFSRSETNDADCETVMQAGGNVAVVFRKDLPERHQFTSTAYPVIDGDLDDLRHLDPKGVIVGLKAKGSARKDTSGFVVDLAA